MEPERQDYSFESVLHLTDGAEERRQEPRSPGCAWSGTIGARPLIKEAPDCDRRALRISLSAPHAVIISSVIS